MCHFSGSRWGEPGRATGRIQGGGQRQMPKAGRRVRSAEGQPSCPRHEHAGARSGWQREDGQQEEGALGSPVSLAGSPDHGSEVRDLISQPI